MKAKARRKQRGKAPAKDHARRRFEAAATKHWRAARRRDPEGDLLFAFLDAALQSVRPSQADAARDNALRLLRRRARRAQGGTAR